MRKPWSWRKGLVVLVIAVAAFVALPAAQAQQVFVNGTVVALEGTPHLWIADEQGFLHWGGDTRALAGRHINWNARTEVSLAGLRALSMGDPWLSAGLLKDGDPIYLVKWETEWPQPRLLHIQSIADVELFGINETNYGNFVLDVATWEARYGISVARLQRAELPPAVPSAGMAPTTPSTPAGVASAEIPYKSIRGYDAGAGTLDLPQGEVTLYLEFGGWGAGPATVTYQIGDGTPVRLIDNERVPFYFERVISVPQAATYTFTVSAVRDWRIWVGLEPGLPSVPLPLDGCSRTMRWHESEEGVHRARYDCAGVRLDGTSYSEINTEEVSWVVWYRSDKFLAVTSTGSAITTADQAVAYQAIKGYNGGAGQLTLPQGQVTIMIEYGHWNSAPITVTYRTPSGESVTLIDAARVPFRSHWVINVAQAGVYGFQINANQDWRLWVGVDAEGIASRLTEVELPVDGCSTTNKWKLTDGVYQARFKCPSSTLKGAVYPGLNTDKGFWVVWRENDAFLDVTFHER